MTCPPGLLALIKEHSWTPHHKVLLCAQDIEEALRAEATNISAGYPGSAAAPEAVLLALMGIDVVVAGDSAPGTWQLTRHDHCEVVIAEREDGTTDLDKTYVSHQDCTVIARSHTGKEGGP